MKRCSQCKESKTLDQFSKNKSNKDGLMRQCKPCNSIRASKYYHEVRRGTPTESEKIRTRRFARHGLTETQYEEILSSQNGHCAMCSVSEELVIDHNHACCPGIYSCGKCVRGLLCRAHNTALGSFNDSVEELEKAIKYLRS